jgi:hypothetical protein
VNIRIDADTAALLKRIARERGMTKAEVVRQALAALREKSASSAGPRPYDRIAHLIGSWHSGGMNLSERTSKKFARLLKERRRRDA